MKEWSSKLTYYLKITIISLIFIIFCTHKTYSNEITIEIKGNDFTDENVILSLLKNQPTDTSTEYSNYIVKTLNNSMLFENVFVEIDNNKFIVTISEFANINKIYFENNDRFDDKELNEFAESLNLTNINPVIINEYINEIEKLYESFGYNNLDISFIIKNYQDTNTADIYFEINEGEITKIKNIYFEGNKSVDTAILKSLIKSKTKTLINILANNNFKKFEIVNDTRLINNYYKELGFLDINIDFSIEYLKSNKVNIYFKIFEGDIYTFKEINFVDSNNILSKNIENKIKEIINKKVVINEPYSLKKVNELNNSITNIIIKDGLKFFEIKSLEKKDKQKVSIIYNAITINPKYTNQINIYGNSRTYDYVIRRELEISEGDAIYKSQLERIQKKLNSLNLFKSVSIVEKEIDDNLVDLEIEVEETQTGTFNAGLSIGTIQGFGVVAGLSEKNFYGTGRSLKALVNTTEDRTEFTLETTDRLFYENNVDITYKANFKQEDYSVASSYKLDTLLTGVGVGYNINTNLRHFVNFDYVIKDYTVTNSSTVSTAIGNSAGESVSFLLKNRLLFNTLNSLLVPNDGLFINYLNTIETPTSSSNGFVKNLITFKNYKKINKNILSFQALVGNIISLNGNDILTDDKFSLGGRWLRGFDSFGAGPRNSRTSYVGGNNIITTKIDYSREVTRNSNFPLYVNLFNDYGLLWENKTKPTQNDSSLRSSAGFGIKYYSPIGPIGFSWGFPIADEEYDIKRMFLFSVGNID